MPVRNQGLPIIYFGLFDPFFSRYLHDFLFRYASVECENNSSPKDKTISDMYLAFVKRLSMTLKTVGDETEEGEYRSEIPHLDKRTNSTSSCSTRSAKAIC